MTYKLRTEPWPQFERPRPCPVCGRSWRPWKGSRLLCHAKCLFTDDEAVALLHSTEPTEKLAERLGITLAILRAGIAKGRSVLAKRRILERAG